MRFKPGDIVWCYLDEDNQWLPGTVATPFLTADGMRWIVQLAGFFGRDMFVREIEMRRMNVLDLTQ